MATGAASGRKPQMNALVRRLYEDLVRRTRNVLLGAQLPELEKAGDVAGMYVALGQLHVTLSAFIEEAATRREAPMGFRPRRESPDKRE